MLWTMSETDARLAYVAVPVVWILHLLGCQSAVPDLILPSRYYRNVAWNHKVFVFS